MRKRTGLYLYILLNIIVSAATTLAVLVIWDRTHGLDLFSLPSGEQQVAAEQAITGLETPTAEPTPTVELPPLDQPVIQIISVIGVGDLEQEVVELKRLGEGNLSMAGWKLQGEHGNTYVFPDQPALVLHRDGEVQVFSKPGTDSVSGMYWNRSEPAWRKGEIILVIDPAGNTRASYSIP